MTDDRQMDLFDWSAAMEHPTATIIAFPFNERAFRVRLASRRLHRIMETKGAAAFDRAMRTEKNRMWGRLEKEGLCEPMIWGLVHEFECDIDDQMQILSGGKAMLTEPAGGDAA